MEPEPFTLFEIIIVIFFSLLLFDLIYLLTVQLFSVLMERCKTLLYLRALSRFPPLYKLFEMVLLRQKPPDMPTI